jgi:hypothetical protein
VPRFHIFDAFGPNRFRPSATADDAIPAIAVATISNCGAHGAEALAMRIWCHLGRFAAIHKS